MLEICKGLWGALPPTDYFGMNNYNTSMFQTEYVLMETRAGDILIDIHSGIRYERIGVSKITEIEQVFIIDFIKFIKVLVI